MKSIQLFVMSMMLFTAANSFAQGGGSGVGGGDLGDLFKVTLENPDSNECEIISILIDKQSSDLGTEAVAIIADRCGIKLPRGL
jgi:hypothetical protein